jgi:hypothetical protein
LPDVVRASHPPEALVDLGLTEIWNLTSADLLDVVRVPEGVEKSLTVILSVYGRKSGHP